MTRTEDMQARELGDAAEAVGRETPVDAGVCSPQLGQFQRTTVIDAQSRVDRQLKVVLEPRHRRTWHAAGTTAQ